MHVLYLLSVQRVVSLAPDLKFSHPLCGKNRNLALVQDGFNRVHYDVVCDDFSYLSVSYIFSQTRHL